MAVSIFEGVHDFDKKLSAVLVAAFDPWPKIPHQCLHDASPHIVAPRPPKGFTAVCFFSFVCVSRSRFRGVRARHGSPSASRDARLTGCPDDKPRSSTPVRASLPMPKCARHAIYLRSARSLSLTRPLFSSSNPLTYSSDAGELYFPSARRACEEHQGEILGRLFALLGRS